MTLASPGYSLTKKIALGSAQFGMRYGVANTSGQVSRDAVHEILRRANDAGIDTLDTASAYGSSEKVLGTFGLEDWKIVTKLPPMPGDVADAAGWARSQVDASLNRLGLSKLHGLLLHRPRDLYSSNGASYLRALQEIKSSGLVGSLGVSVYSPDELTKIMDSFEPDIVQAPLNVIDRRLIQSGWLDRLRQAGVAVHVRSVFLQGLLLMDSARLPAYFSRWRDLFGRWHSWCQSAKVSPAGAALAFAIETGGIERVIVGVDSLAQLESALAAADGHYPRVPAQLQCDDPGLINPSAWELD